MFSFSPTSGFRDSGTYPTVPASESDARDDLQSIPDQLKNHLNKHGAIAIDSGTTNAMVITLTTDVISNSDVLLVVSPAYTNTSTGVTLNINGLGAVNVYKNSTVPLLAGDLRQDSFAILAYSTVESSYQLLNPTWVNTTGATANKVLGMNATTDGVEWKESLQSIITAEGDLIYGSTSATPTVLSKGSAYEYVMMNPTTTGIEWGTGLKTIITAEGDLIYGTGANTPAILTKGNAYEHLGMNATTTAPEWQPSANSVLTAQGDILYASGANTLARLAKGTAGQILSMNATTTAPEWKDSIQAYLTKTHSVTLYSTAPDSSFSTTAMAYSPSYALVVLRNNFSSTGDDIGLIGIVGSSSEPVSCLYRASNSPSDNTQFGFVSNTTSTTVWVLSPNVYLSSIYIDGNTISGSLHYNGGTNDNASITFYALAL